MHSMLMIVIEKPIQLTIVSDVPFDPCGAYRATNVENIGESAITAKLHTSKKMSTTEVDSMNKNNGDTRQQKQEVLKARMAIFFSPKRCERIPASTQAKAPMAIMTNDHKETDRVAVG